MVRYWQVIKYNTETFMPNALPKLWKILMPWVPIDYLSFTKKRPF
jgi:hypothetical protein